MEKNLLHFLNSNLLNKYLVGETSIDETKEVEFFIEKGANDWNWGMKSAARGVCKQNKDLVDFFYFIECVGGT